MLVKRILGYVKTILVVDKCLNSQHLPTLKCIYILRRNYILITSGSERVKNF